LPPEQKVGGSNPLGRTKFLKNLRDSVSGLRNAPGQVAVGRRKRYGHRNPPPLRANPETNVNVSNLDQTLADFSANFYHVGQEAKTKKENKK
jgi:hypothetical protein